MSHRDDLLEAAKRLVVERGYGRTTARDLVAASGTNLGSIGYHFGTKDALLSQAVHDLFGEWTQEIQRTVRGDGADVPLAQMGETIRALADGAPAHRSLGIAWLEAVLQATRDPDTAAAARAGMLESREEVAADVRAAIGDEALGVSRHVAILICAICDGLLIQYLVDPESFPTGEELVASLGAALELALRE